MPVVATSCIRRLSECEGLPAQVLQHVQATSLLRTAPDADVQRRVHVPRQQDGRRELHVDQKLRLLRVKLRPQQQQLMQPSCRVAKCLFTARELPWIGLQQVDPVTGG